MVIIIAIFSDSKSIDPYLLHFVWGKDQQRALDTLKTKLLPSNVLAFPYYDVPCHIPVDTSSQGTGYMLYQIHPEEAYPTGATQNNRNKVVRFGFKAITKWQQSYSLTKLELLEAGNFMWNVAIKLQKKLRNLYERCLSVLEHTDGVQTSS